MPPVPYEDALAKAEAVATRSARILIAQLRADMEREGIELSEKDYTALELLFRGTIDSYLRHFATVEEAKMNIEDFVKALGEAFGIPLTGKFSTDCANVTIFLERACDYEIEELWKMFGPSPSIEDVVDFVVEEQNAINEAGVAELERARKLRI